MNEDSDLTPEEIALRKLDNEETVSDENKKGLSDLENAKEQKVVSIGRVERQDYAKDGIDETHLKHGFFNLDVTEFPSSGRFYAPGIKVRIKAATVKDIRTFSALDEENPFEVDEALVELLSNCVRVNFANRVGSWKDLLEEDRLNLILSIRELTFAEGENKIAFKVKCESCGTSNDMEVTNENFQKRELPEKIAKYFSEENRVYNIETKSFGIITMQPPTIGVMRIVNKYIKELRDRQENMKQYLPFLKILPYLIDEWRGFNYKEIQNLRMEVINWGSKEFLLRSDLSEKMQIGVKEEMRTPCSKCGDPIEAKIELPKGIKGLFIDSDNIEDELI